MIYDVAIVGAGPAGLMAAKTAAEKGLKVALIEKKSSVSRDQIAQERPGLYKKIESKKLSLSDVV